jgi:hypothetical protein
MNTRFAQYVGKPGTSNHQAKLSNEEALAVLKLDHAGVDRTLIADVFGIARGTVYDIASARSWKHLVV